MRRGDVVVCIVVPDTAHVAASLASVWAHTHEKVPVMFVGRAIEPALTPENREVLFTSEHLEQALTMAAPADVVVLTPPVVVTHGWLEELRMVADGDSRIATVSALQAGGGTAEITLPPQMTLDEAAARVREASPGNLPRLPAPEGSCIYVRRSALELVGESQGWEDFASCCIRVGMTHVLADRLLIESRECAGPGAIDAVQSPRRRAVQIAKRSLNGLSVLIDARILGGTTTGTKLHVLELVSAVARTGLVRTSVLTAERRDPEVQARLEALPGVGLVTPSGAQRSRWRADIVHRPYQVDTPADLGILGELGDRLVVTQQDLIAYQNPFYFASREKWEGYRSITRSALAAADHVIFPSAHARAEAIAEELVDPGRVSVVRLGVDHGHGHVAGASPPAGVDRIPEDAEVMICIGSDYWHKNRLFALRLADHLHRRSDWSGWLVLAGAHMSCGSSAAAEAELITRSHGLAEAVLDLGEVTEPEKSWLFRRAALVLFPTVYEGFGLVPFEAAAHGVPCLWTKGTALSEVLPDSLAGIDPWDLETSAAHALSLIRDATIREGALQSVREAAAALRWNTLADRLVQIYEATFAAPAGLGGLRERDSGLMQRGLSEDALRLVGPGGVLPPELERPLLALASQHRLRRPVFAALRVGYRASLRRRRRYAEDRGLS